MSDNTFISDKVSRFFNKLEDEAVQTGDWSSVDKWRDISFWLEKNVFGTYDTAVDDLECNLSDAEFRVEELERYKRDYTDMVEELQTQLADAEHEITRLKSDIESIVMKVGGCSE